MGGQLPVDGTFAVGGGAEVGVLLVPSHVGADGEPHGERRNGGAVDGGEGAVFVVVGRGDRLELDVVRAEGHAREQRLGGPEHGRVGAPVDPQAGQASAGGMGGLDIGVNVGTAEGVDGLLGIADQHERGGRDAVPLSGIGLPNALPEDVVEDRPLNGIGVLELVDEGDLVALPECLAGVASRQVVIEGLAKPGEEVIERERPSLFAAAVDLGGDLVDQDPQTGGPGV